MTTTSIQHSTIPKLALPLMLSYITTPLLGLINTVIAGHFQHAYYLAAIGLGTMIFNFLYWGLGFFRMTTTGLAAQAYGENNRHKLHSLIAHSLCLALLMGCGLIVLQYPLYHFFLLWIHSHHHVIDLMHHYYNVRIWGAPAVLANFVIIGLLIGIQKTRGPLIILTFINVLAMGLSLWLGMTLHLKLIGLAWSDVLAQYAGLLVGLYLLHRVLDVRKILKHATLTWQRFTPLLHANRDVFIRSLCLMIVFSFFTLWSGHISVMTLAVNTLLLNFFHIMTSILGGFDNVAEALCGEAVGAGNRHLFRHSLFRVGYWSLGCSVLLSVIYFSCGETFLQHMTNIASVQHMAQTYLPFIVFLPLISFVSFLLDGAAIGANLFKDMRNGMVLTLILFFGVWYLLTPYHNVGLWLAFYSFFVLRAVFLGYFICIFIWNISSKVATHDAGNP